MTIRGIIFDLFHTLTGRESEWSELPWTSDVLGIDRQQWNDLLTRHSRWRLAGEERDHYTILATLARQANPRIADHLIQEALGVRAQRFRDCFSRIPPENLRTVQALRARGYRLALLSNADTMEVEGWRDCPLAGLFDVEVFSCEVGMVKPERAIYEHCLAALGLPAEECLFVGDGGSDELTGAKAAGITPVFVSGVMSELWPEKVSARMAECCHHIEGLSEVLDILQDDSAPGSRSR